MKYFYIFAALALAAMGTYWYGTRAGWFVRTGPDNLPTAEERRRMEEIDKSSSEIAPDAIPGIGVVPVGSKQMPQAASSSDASTTESAPPLSEPAL